MEEATGEMIGYSTIHDPGGYSDGDKAEDSTQAEDENPGKLRKKVTKTSDTDDGTAGIKEKGRLQKRPSENTISQRYFWDVNKHGPNVTVLEDQQDTIRRGVARQHTDGARGSVGYNKGRHTFKFTFNDKPWGSHCAIGVCSAHSKLSLKGYQHLFGADALSWAWDLPSGCLLHAGETKQMFKDKMNIKVIYMTLDMNRGTLYFQPKGMERFQAFSGLKDGGRELLFPAVSLVYGLAEVRISMEKSESDVMEKEKYTEKEKKQKESRNRHKRRDEKEDGTEFQNEDINKSRKKASRVSFEVSDNEDEKSDEDDLGRSEFEKNDLAGVGKPAQPFLTSLLDSLGAGEMRSVAPVDDPSPRSTSPVYRDKAEGDDAGEFILEGRAEANSKSGQNELSVENQCEGSEFESTAKHSYRWEWNSSPTQDDKTKSLYLNRRETTEAELFTVEGDSLQKEFVTERERTSVSLNRPTVLERESTLEAFRTGIPEPAAYEPQRETNADEAASEVEKKKKPKKKKGKDLKVLDPKSAHNLSVLLGSIRVSHEEIKRRILEIDEEHLTPEMLEQLIKYMPEPEQLNALAEFKSEYDSLVEAEQFGIVISSVKRVGPRLSSMVFKMRFGESVTAVKLDVVAATAALEEVKHSGKFARILELKLLLDNNMNADSHKAQSVQFEISDLAKLENTKSGDQRKTLLHCLIETMEKKFPDLLSFQEELIHIEQAAKVSPESCQENLYQIDKSLKQLETNIKNAENDKMADPNDQFLPVMSNFLKIAKDQYEVLDSMTRKMSGLFTEIAEYFAFDPTKYTMEDLFADLNLFCQQFTDAQKHLAKQRDEEERQKKMVIDTTTDPKDRPEAIKRYLSSITAQSTAYEYEQPVEDLEEPEDAQYIKVEYLNEEEQYDMQVTHGWDLCQKGGGIQLYPNIPYICIPIPRFQGRVQSVRSKRGFKWGIHKWLIRELPFYSPSLRLAEDGNTASGIHIGVVSEEYRWFNQGFQRHCSGRYTWSWDSATGEITQAGVQLQTSDGETGSLQNGPVNLQAGLVLTLNMYKHKVTLTSGSKIVAEIRNIRGKEIFPYVLFNQKGYYPVEIKYLEGPEEYVDKVLNELKTKDGKYGEHSKNFQGLTRQITTSSNMVSIETGISSASYDWGVTSTGLKTSWGRTISLSKKAGEEGYHYLAIAQSALYSGRHKIDFETKHIGDCIFGLVSEHFDQDFIAHAGPIRNSSDSACVTTLGTNSFSWGWDPKTSSLFHGGRFVGKYPRKELEVDWTEYSRLQLMVDFGHNGYNIASFRAISEDNRPLDLGIAFVSLPDCVWPAVAIVTGSSEHSVKLHMKYVAGPKEFITEMKSGVCAIL